jgi:hypothetical protein
MPCLPAEWLDFRRLHPPGKGPCSERGRLARRERLAEQSAADPTFRKVAESALAFRRIYKSWATRRG